MIIKAPEGVEYDIVVYLTSDSTGIDLRFRIGGAKTMTDEFDLAALAEINELADVAKDFRPMTRAEIKTYKEEAEDE